MEQITSLQNSKVKEWAKLLTKKQRDKTGLFLVEDEHLLEEAHMAGLLKVMLVLDNQKYDDVQTYQVTPQILEKLSETVSKARCIGICQKPVYTKDVRHCILLEDVQDPGNVGTIIRTAYSFGFDACILTSGCADVYSSKVIRSTQGAFFHMPVIHMKASEAISMLKQKGVTVIGTCLQDSKPLQDVTCEGSVCLVMGNEGSGMKEETRSLCDMLVRIEMSNFESLNVAVAAGIAAYTFRR
ncbi:MAG: RNA methyltransferase [Erysipelotrichaceae bacterium]|nr:RNA methyltransferase [Erysipelotrichaceae bacterium]